jgi:hypothetical protein
MCISLKSRYIRYIVNNQQLNPLYIRYKMAAIRYIIDSQ